MRIFLIVMVASSLVLSGCSGWSNSRANPSNWFGGGRPTPAQTPAETGATTAAQVNPLLPERTSIMQRDREEIYEGTIVDQVSEIFLERTSTGAILRATGITALQGAFDVRLINLTDGEPADGVLRFSLHALQPTQQGAGNTTARTVRTGVYLSSQVLERSEVIEVIAARNALSTRP